jgi:hypothetical protein
LRSLQGLDLKIGGEGMRGFYDQILPATVNKLVKNYGGRVGSGEIETGRTDVAGTGWGAWESNGRLIGRFQSRQRAEEEAEASGGTIRVLGSDKKPVHMLDLTPRLKDTALKTGFPLFAIGGGLLAVPINHDPFADDR